MTRTLCLGVLVIFLGGCSLFGLPPLPAGAIRPSVAVTSFENRTGVEGQIQLGTGMADLLVSELVGSGHFEVLERQHLEPLVGEIQLQEADLFRSEGKVARGNLKNARYQIRGVVTDFTHVRGGAVDFFIKRLIFGGRGYTAQVGLTLSIVDIESGKVVASVQSAGDASAGSAYLEAGYSDIGFGGDAFFRTPLGHATRDAIRDALHKIIDSIDYDYWRPTIAAVSPERIVVSGGASRGIRLGDVFDVRETPRTITDPQTGDVITELAGEIVGTIRITSVEEEAAFAEVVEGDGFQRGQRLLPAVAEIR